MNHIGSRFARGARALLAGGALFVAASAPAAEVYRDYLDPGVPHHRAILDTLERLKTSPDDPGLHNDLGCLIAWDGFWKDALREFDRAAKLAPKDGRPFFNSGLVHASRGDWSSAKKSFKAATNRDRGNWPAWWMLGFAYEKLGDVQPAVDAYKTALRIDTSLFDVARNPFASATKLKMRVLLETYGARVARTGMPSREEFADPDRITGFFQKAKAPAAEGTAAEAAAPAPTGPIVTSAPSSATGPGRAAAPTEVRAPRIGRGVESDPNSEQAAPPPPQDNLPFQNVTPAPPSRRRTTMGPGMGPGGMPGGAPTNPAPQPQPPQPAEQEP